MMSGNIWNFIRQGKDFYCHSKARRDNIMFNDFLLFQTKQTPPIFTSLYEWQRYPLSAICDKVDRVKIGS